jgi:hypothetical protein
MSKIIDKIQDPRIRIPAATVLGFSLAALLYATSKNPNKTIGRAALHGVGFALSLNLIGWLIARDGRQIPLLAVAQSNGDDYDSMGKLSKAAVSVLSQIDADRLYKPMKKNGLKVAPIPENPSVVNQDEG